MSINRAITFLKRPWVVVFLIIVGFMVAAWPLLWQPLSTDQGVAATIAQQILQGKLLYKDIWHFNTPGIHLTYALGLVLLGQTATAVNWWYVIWQTLTIVAVFVAGRSLFSVRAGLWSAFIYAATVSTVFAVPGSIGDKESFIALPLILSFYFWHKANRGNFYPPSPRTFFLRKAFRKAYLWFSLLTGLSVGWLCYYKLIYGVVVVGLLFLPILYKVKFKVFIERATIMCLGFLLAWLPFIIYLSHNHLWFQTYQQLIIFALAYGRFYYTLSPVKLWLLETIVFLFFVIALLPNLFFLVWGLWQRKVNDIFRKNRLMLAIISVLLIAAVMAQRKLFFYQWQVVSGSLALLSGAALSLLFKQTIGGWLRTRHNIILGVVILISFLISARYWVSPHASGSIINAQEAVEVSDYLKINHACDKNEKLQIWGAWSAIYFLSRCQPATPFIYNQPFIIHILGEAAKYQQELKQGFFTQLTQQPPTYMIIIRAVDDLWVDKNMVMPLLTPWLINNYDLVKKFGDFYIYRYKY